MSSERHEQPHEGTSLECLDQIIARIQPVEDVTSLDREYLWCCFVWIVMWAKEDSINWEFGWFVIDACLLHPDLRELARAYLNDNVTDPEDIEQLGELMALYFFVRSSDSSGESDAADAEEMLAQQLSLGAAFSGAEGPVSLLIGYIRGFRLTPQVANVVLANVKIRYGEAGLTEEQWQNVEEFLVKQLLNEKLCSGAAYSISNERLFAILADKTHPARRNALLGILALNPEDKQPFLKVFMDIMLNPSDPHYQLVYSNTISTDLDSEDPD